MPRYKIYIRDRFGNVAGKINGIEVAGPAVGAKNIAFIPEGGIVSGIGNCSFDLPLMFVQNSAIQKGTELEIWQSDIYDGPVFWGIVINRPRTLGPEGIYAKINCLDVLAELASVTTTSGFVSRASELASTMLNRLVARQTETKWYIRSTLPDTYANFSAYGMEVIRAIGKYCAEHYASYKRETYHNPINGLPARRVVIGQFATEKSGLRLITPQKEYGSVPEEKRPAEIRGVISATFDDDANIVNRLIPIAGNDTASANITLATLFGRTDFTGYNAAYPVKARLREDNTDATISPLYEFYVENTLSITNNRLSEQVYARPDITPLSTNPGDVEVAATTLYAAAVNYIQDHINLHLSLDIITENRGDIRNIAGKTVYVRCQAISKKKDSADVYMMDIEGDYRVEKVEVTNADSDGQCKWTLSTDGRSVETDDTMFQGALEDIDYLKKAPTLLIAFPVYPIDSFLDGYTRYEQRFPSSNAFVRIQQVMLDLNLVNVLSPVRPLVHAHTVTAPNHTHNISVSSHTHPISLPDHVHSMYISAHYHLFSFGDHSHTVSVGAHTHGAGTGDHGHTQNIGSHSHAVIGTKPFIDLKGVGAVITSAVGKNGETVVTDIRGTDKTADHTHGQTSAQGAVGASNAAGGAFNINTGGAGGISQGTGYAGSVNSNTGWDGGFSGNSGAAGAINTSTSYSGGFTVDTSGAGGFVTGSGTNAGAEWGLMVGPKPELIWIWINNIYIGEFTSNLRVDITAQWKLQQDNDIIVVSGGTQTNPTGLGRIQGAVLARLIGTTLANQNV